MSLKKLLEALFLLILLEGFSPWLSKILNINIQSSLPFSTLLYLIKGFFLSVLISCIHPKLKKCLFSLHRLNRSSLKSSLWGILLGFLLYIQAFFASIFFPPTSINFLQNISYPCYIFFPMSLILCFAIALSEETFYRVYISHVFLKKIKNIWIKILFITIFFSLAHEPSSFQKIVLLSILSFEITLTYELTKDITLVIIGHTIYNFFVVLSFFF